MHKVRYWRAALLAYVASTLVFLGLPLPEDLSTGEQVLVLVIIQVAAILGSFCFVWIRSKKADFQFDLLPRDPSILANSPLRLGSDRRRHLMLVSSGSSPDAMNADSPEAKRPSGHRPN